MRKYAAVGAGLILLAGITVLCWVSPQGDWKGVDEAVVEKVATEAGRSPGEPLLNPDRGDLLLLLFLLAGATGGFVGGYCFRDLFPPGAPRSRGPSHV
jgi:ABC-type cobalt transport system substrate-binding protein